jgi:steroid delta-isomerase-like uncharacterized protein
MSDDSKLALLERHMQAENARDLHATLATLTPDCLFEDLALGHTYRGRDEAAEYYRLWWEAFAPTVLLERLYWTRDGQAIVETRWRGVHEGRWLAVEPTRRRIDVPVAIFVTFGEDDLMAGERFYYDLTTIRRQISAG